MLVVFSPSSFSAFDSGIATIYAVKNAGLAIGMGISSSCIVLSSFTWGIFFFEEKVHSRLAACFAIACLMAGLFGMSYYGSNSSASSSNKRIAVPTVVDDSSVGSDDEPSISKGMAGSCMRRNREVVTGDSSHNSPRIRRSTSMGSTSSATIESERGDVEMKSLGDQSGGDVPSPPISIKKRGIRRSLSRGKVVARSRSYSDSKENIENDEEEMALMGGNGDNIVSVPIDTVVILGKEISRRHWGMFVAGVFGLWGGSVMAPMKLCKADIQGSRFVISFGIGASLVTLFFWLVRYFYHVYKCKSMSKAYARLPSFHLRVMWLPGGLSGLLWSVGNFFSLISVKHLGQGVGYPLVQSQILVAGLWGILYYKEVQKERICRWLLSSLVTLSGILLLSYQHVNEK